MARKMTKGFRKNSEAALVEGKGRTCKRKKMSTTGKGIGEKELIDALQKQKSKHLCGFSISGAFFCFFANLEAWVFPPSS